MSDLMKKNSAELRDIYVKLFEMRIKTAHSDFIPACDGKFLPSAPFTAIKNGAELEKVAGGYDSLRYCYSFADGNQNTDPATNQLGVRITAAR